MDNLRSIAEGMEHEAQQIKHLVDRFLGWQLPENFNPDAGISFKRSQYPMPTGTNLFDANQAEEMVRYMLGGLNLEIEVPIQTTKIERERLLELANERIQELSCEIEARVQAAAAEMREQVAALCDARAVTRRNNAKAELSFEGSARNLHYADECEAIGTLASRLPTPTSALDAMLLRARIETLKNVRHLCTCKGSGLIERREYDSASNAMELSGFIDCSGPICSRLAALTQPAPEKDAY